MMADNFPDLGELERAVMQLVWAHAPLTAESVRERLERGLKESTVRTVLRRLEDKGYVTHALDGRTFVYHAVATRGDVAARVVKRVVDWFCNGSMEEMLVGMVDNRMLDGKQIEELARLIDASKKRRR
jgi:predicted transcriptional regulator